MKLLVSFSSLLIAVAMDKCFLVLSCERGRLWKGSWLFLIRLSFSKLIILFSWWIFAAVEIFLYSIVPYLWSHLWVRPHISCRELWWIPCRHVLASISTEKLYSHVTTTPLLLPESVRLLVCLKKMASKKVIQSFHLLIQVSGLVYISYPKTFTAQDSHLFFFFA